MVYRAVLFAGPLVAVGAEVYCPSAADLIKTWDSLPSGSAPKIVDQGWTTTNGGGVATKTSFNLLGGSVEFDFDVSKTLVGVNANVYTISPLISKDYYNATDYCDGQGADGSSDWCAEIDYIESNGNCGGATTYHTVPGTGNQACTAWGCSTSYHYDGQSMFHMKIDYGTDGSITTHRDGQVLSSYSPVPDSATWSVVVDAQKTRGSVIMSTQWVGWTPVSDCGSGGKLEHSTFSVSNLKVTGEVVQGPVPTLCANQPSLQV